MESKTEATMWKSLKSWVRNRCQKLPCILFWVTYRENKQCEAFSATFLALDKYNLIYSQFEHWKKVWGIPATMICDFLTKSWILKWILSINSLPPTRQHLAWIFLYCLECKSFNVLVWMMEENGRIPTYVSTVERKMIRVLVALVTQLSKK